MIDTRIRDFLATFPAIIRDTSASAFENFRSGAATDVAETDKVRQIHKIVLIVTAALSFIVSRAAECWRSLKPLVA